MKPTTGTYHNPFHVLWLRLFFKHSLQPCENSSPYSWLSWSRLRSSTPAQSRKSSPLPALVSLVSRAGLLAATSNRRLYVGAWLITVLSPLASVSYHLFDRTSYNETDFYGNAFYYFYSVCPYISLLLCLTGVFLLFPEFSKRKFFLLIPSTYYFSKIIWLSMVDNNADFHRIVPWSVVGLALVAALVWYFTWEWLMTLHFHKKTGHLARVEGILNTPGLEDSYRVEIARQEFKKYHAL